MHQFGVSGEYDPAAETSSVAGLAHGVSSWRRVHRVTTSEYELAHGTASSWYMPRPRSGEYDPEHDVHGTVVDTAP